MTRHAASVVGLRNAVSGVTAAPAAVGAVPNKAKSSGEGLARVDFFSVPKMLLSRSNIAALRVYQGEGRQVFPRWQANSLSITEHFQVFISIPRSEDFFSGKALGLGTGMPSVIFEDGRTFLEGGPPVLFIPMR